MCRLLHDVIEDTSLNGEDLLAKGVARSIVESVLVLTHDKTKTYFEYIQCIIDSHNKTAIAVKLNDLKHNYERSLKYGFDEQYQNAKSNCYDSGFSSVEEFIKIIWVISNYLYYLFLLAFYYCYKSS